MMKNLLRGLLFSLFSLSAFMAARMVAGLWPSFACSLFITTAVFLFSGFKGKWSGVEIMLVSFSTGVFYLAFACFGIYSFPPEPIRDLGDLIMPYLHAGVFAVCTVVVMGAAGMVFFRLR
ncbi:hypothetical protein CN378_19005 [Bacillus sp. AFS015802]|uniref:hypothetical protein n=1 Tax=Bacillus sp. AFS015802 TaxID=2033486 RepID=UPI000BF48DB2|nr:hypothetical protein [Bacillus sp. AFS015802]PFA63118.1 hypothetical protein CN378_19005 [Bacillus sp. AFS015802]